MTWSHFRPKLLVSGPVDDRWGWLMLLVGRSEPDITPPNYVVGKVNSGADEPWPTTGRSNDGDNQSCSLAHNLVGISTHPHSRSIGDGRPW